MQNEIDVLAYPLEEAEEMLKRANVQYLCIETKSPFVYNVCIAIKQRYVVNQLITDNGAYLIYIAEKQLRGGVNNGI